MSSIWNHKEKNDKSMNLSSDIFGSHQHRWLDKAMITIQLVTDYKIINLTDTMDDFSPTKQHSINMNLYIDHISLVSKKQFL